MALLGLGIVVLSIVFLSYRHGPAACGQYLRKLLSRQEEHGTQSHGKGGRSSGGSSGAVTVGSGSPTHKSAPAFSDSGEEASSMPLSSRQSQPSHRMPSFEVTDTVMDSEAPTMSLEQDDGTTPKASATRASPEVPTFSLVDDETSGGNNGRLFSMQAPPPPPPPPSSDANNVSNNSAASTPSATKPSGSSPVKSSLMPPPSIKPSALRPLPRVNGTDSSASSLMPPPSAASALRVPQSRPSAAPNSLASSARNPSLAASTSTLPPASRPSRKVILPPGHSPLDWAALCRSPPTPGFLRGEGVPARMLKVSPAQLRHYNGRRGRDAWGTWQGKVYNLTPYRDFHPGGVKELMRGAGRPGETERLFKEVHPWVNWDGMLAECLIGVLVAEGEGEGESGSAGSDQMDMDAMD